MEEFAYISLYRDEVSLLSQYMKYQEQLKYIYKRLECRLLYKLDREALSLFLYRIPVNEFTVDLRLKLQQAGQNIFGW